RAGAGSGRPGAGRDDGAAGAAHRTAVAGGVEVMLAALAAGIHLQTVPSPTPHTIPGAGIFQSSYILSLAIWIPVAVAVVISVVPNPRRRIVTFIQQIAFSA